MRKKLTLRCLVISFISAAIVFAAALGTSFWLCAGSAKRAVEEKARLVISLLKESSEPFAALEGISGTRLTVTDEEGRVIFDSLGEVEEDHMDREEIISAAQGEPLTVRRYSETEKGYVYYHAEKFTVGGSEYILRTADKEEGLAPYFGAAAGALCLAVAVGAAVAAVFARRISGSVSGKLNAVNMQLQKLVTGKAERTDGDEFADIAAELEELVDGLGGSLADMKRERSKLEFVFNNMSQGVLAFSSRNEIVLYNKPVKKIFRIKEEVMGEHFSRLTQDEKLKELMHEALIRGEDGEFSYRLGGKDLNFKVYSFKAAGEDSEIEHIVLIADLTKEKAAMRQKSEFFANASHELKTPLTTMQGLTEILLAKSGSEGEKSRLERIYKESKRLSSLVQDMLYISDLESGRAERREEDVDLGAVLAEVRQEYAHQAEERGIRVFVSGEGRVRADYRNIYEVVGNLCSNAVHYNTPGGKVEMRVQESEKGVLLTVADTGIGIAEEHLPKVCERFYRVDKSRSKKTGGTGLGLAIVKHVCNVYGAALDIKSKPGEGTCVTVFFPARRRGAEAQEKA